MVVTTNQLLEQLKDYANPFGKISRMVKQNKLYLLKKGLYETDGNASGLFLSGAIYGPSYISFEAALSYYGMIPEAVYSFTNATCLKLKKKEYQNHFGVFRYRDIPLDAFPYGIKMIDQDEYSFRIASKEKALCDKLYTCPIVRSQKEMEYLLFEDMRIDEDIFSSLNKEDIYFIAPKYHSTNLNILSDYLRRKYHE